MFRNTTSLFAVAILAFVLGGLVQPFRASAGMAQAGCQTFKETGKTVCGKFLQYWQQHGGLAQQGLPLSNEFQEVSDVDQKIYTVQYFERAVFELHPENKPPHDVLLSLLGTFQFKNKYPNAEPVQTQPPTIPQGPASPSTIGQRVEFRGMKNALIVVTVTDVKESYRADGSSKFVTIIATMKNTSTIVDGLYPNPGRLRDNLGGFHSPISIFDQQEYADKYNLPMYGGRIQPGGTVKAAITYEVSPINATNFVVVPY